MIESFPVETVVAYCKTQMFLKMPRSGSFKIGKYIASVSVVGLRMNRHKGAGCEKPYTKWKYYI